MATRDRLRSAAGFSSHRVRDSQDPFNTSKGEIEMKQLIRITTQRSLRLFLLIALLAGLLAVNGTPMVASASGPVIVIDDFNTGAFSLSGPGGTINNVPALGAIGGVRDILIADSGRSGPSVMSLTPGNGYLELTLGDVPGSYDIGWGSLLFSPGPELNFDASSYD